MREIDEQELLSMLENRALGTSKELARIKAGGIVIGSRAEAIAFFEGRIETYEMLHREFSHELKGESLAPRFFL